MGVQKTAPATKLVYEDDEHQPWHEKEDTKVPESYVWPEDLQPKVAHDAYGEIPLIDLAACHSGDVEGIKKVIEEVDYASREFGAFHIVNHGIPWDVVQNARKAMLRVFYLPLEQKMKAKRDFVRNYSGFGSGSMLCPSKQWNEAFQFLMDDASAPVIIDEYGAKLFGEGTEEKEFFCKSISEYLTENDKVRLLTWDLIIKGLKIKDESHFQKYLGSTTTANKGFRCNYYPPCPNPEKAIGLITHTDTTLGLVQLGDVAGLQIFRDDKWISVNPRKGENTLCVNVGDYIEVLSNNRYKSVIHRVVCNKNEERMSIDCVATPAWDLPLEACPELVDDEHPLIYRPILGKEYQGMKLEGHVCQAHQFFKIEDSAEAKSLRFRGETFTESTVLAPHQVFAKTAEVKGLALLEDVSSLKCQG